MARTRFPRAALAAFLTAASLTAGCGAPHQAVTAAALPFSPDHLNAGPPIAAADCGRQRQTWRAGRLHQRIICCRARATS